jgi:hypothetical protein
MKMRLLPVVALVISAVILVGFTPQEKSGPRGEWRFSPQEDSARFARTNAEVDQKLDEVRKSIAGQEDKPAGEVFKNLKMLGQLKASQIPGIMEFWSRSLGTSCQHCHVVDQWAKEDKPEKQIARDMASMVGEINSKLLVNIKNLDSKNPRIACWTCHEGRIKPPHPPWARNFRRRED